MNIIKQITLAALLSYTTAVHRHHHHHHGLKSHTPKFVQKSSLDDTTGEAEMKMIAHDQELLKDLRAQHQVEDAKLNEKIERQGEYVDKAFDKIDKSRYSIEKEIADA